MKFGPIELIPDVERTFVLQAAVSQRNRKPLTYEPGSFEQALRSEPGGSGNVLAVIPDEVLSIWDSLGLRCDGYSEVETLDPRGTLEQCYLLRFLAIGDVVNDGAKPPDEGYLRADFCMYVRNDIGGPNNVGDLLPAAWSRDAYSIDFSFVVAWWD